MGPPTPQAPPSRPTAHTIAPFDSVIAIAAAISPYRAARDEVRARIPDFVEVYMECPLEVLTARDVKGLYKKALAGEIVQFTGISDPYEPPLTPEVLIHSGQETPEESVQRVWATIENLGLLGRYTESGLPIG